MSLTQEQLTDRLGVLGEELLAEFKRLNARLDGVADQPRDGAVSSIAIEDMAKGPPKITTKLYAHDPLTREQVDEALEAHGYAHREAERRALDGWQETANGLNAPKGAAV